MCLQNTINNKNVYTHFTDNSVLKLYLNVHIYCILS